MIEAYCDEVNEALNQEAYKNNEFLKPRFRLVMEILH